MKHLRRIVTSLVVASMVVAAILLAPIQAFWPVLLALTILATVELAMLLAKRPGVRSCWFVPDLLLGALLLYGAFCGALGSIARLAEPARGSLMLLYVIAIVKISDMGGFALGVAFGRHKLCPSISPNKSWEGLLGSVLASAIMSCLFIPITGFGAVKAIAFGLVAALVGTFGDLVESKFKRYVGVKDSSTLKITNGMGGVLDMFDSLLFAPAAIWLLLELCRRFGC